MDSCEPKPLCREFIIEASRTYKPNLFNDGESDFDPATTILVPSRINVTQGFAGTSEKTCALSFNVASGSSDNIICQYLGGSPVPNPITPDQLEASRFYNFDACSDSEVLSGSRVQTKRVTLRVNDGGSMNDGEVVNVLVSLQESSDLCQTASSTRGSTCDGSPTQTSPSGSNNVNHLLYTNTFNTFCRCQRFKYRIFYNSHSDCNSIRGGLAKRHSIRILPL
jgi:hypothetical protein